MATVCVKCGLPLAEGQSFCTACGTRKAADLPSGTASRFCTGCGASLLTGARLCEKCGASAIGQQSGNASGTSSSDSQIETNHSASPANAPAGGKFLKLLMIAAVLVVLLLLLVMGSCTYIAYRAKQRLEKVQQAYKKDDLAGMVAAATGQSRKPQALPNWKPAPAELAAAPSSKIPLRKSLRLVDAGTDELRGDFESIFVVDSVTDQTVHIHGSQQFPPGQGIEKFLSGSTNTNKPRKIECGRTVFVADMQSSAEFDGYFCRDGREEKHPGTTAMSLSKKTLNELRSTGQSEFTYHEDPFKAVLKSFKKAMDSDSNSSDAASMDLMKKMMNFAPGGAADNDPAAETPPLHCTLRRAGNTDIAFPVLVNDQPVELPVIDVVVKLPDKEGHLYVLDDPDNPLVLAAASNEGGHAQVIKIYWDNEQTSLAANQLEQELEKNGRAKVYDLYFDFASATLRPESKKVLDEIAQVMRAHPDWKLSIEGHTDSIGGSASNLDLSRRRSDAVKQALVSQYQTSADRFSTAGFGASRPVDTNDTMEGRARNRRVELVRQ